MCPSAHRDILFCAMFDMPEDIQRGIIPFLLSPAQSKKLECVASSKEFYQTEELKSLSTGIKCMSRFIIEVLVEK